MLGGEDVAAVVVELGHANTKVGFAGSDSPAHIYPAVIMIYLYHSSFFFYSLGSLKVLLCFFCSFVVGECG